MKGRWIAITILLIALFPVAQADAQAVCDRRETIVAQLTTKYSEAQVAIGIAANGDLMEVYANPDGGWTLMHSRPDGMTCMIAVGTNWQIVEEPFNVPGKSHF